MLKEKTTVSHTQDSSTNKYYAVISPKGLPDSKQKNGSSGPEQLALSVSCSYLDQWDFLQGPMHAKT